MKPTAPAADSCLLLPAGSQSAAHVYRRPGLVLIEPMYPYVMTLLAVRDPGSSAWLNTHRCCHRKQNSFSSRYTD